MASIQVQNVVLQHNPARYTDDFNFHIRFEAIEDISYVPCVSCPLIVELSAAALSE